MNTKIKSRFSGKTAKEIEKLAIKSMRDLEKIAGKKRTLGAMICCIRECDEISQVAFAKKLGVSRQYLCDLEHDRKAVSAKQAAKFAKILGYSESQFVRLAFQDELDRAKINLHIVSLIEQKHAA